MRYPRWKYFQGGSIGGFLGESLRMENGRIYIDLTAIIHSQFLQKWFSSLSQERPQNSPPLNGDSDYIASVFPLILRWHEEPSYYRQQLMILGNNATISSSVQEIGLLWGSALATIILEKVPPQELLTYLTKNVLGEQKILSLMQELIDSRCSYKVGCKKLSKLKLKQVEAMLALYGFIITPDDMGLCLRRSLAVNGDRSRVPYLTGIISGLYNSISGLPLSWRLQIEDNPTVEELRAGAERMYRYWCGMYGELSLDVAVASPGIIQPRRGIKIISQRES